MDNRDTLTKKYFDESTIKLVDKTGDAFLTWFEGDAQRVARLSGAPSNSVLEIRHLDEGGFLLSAEGEYLLEPMVRLILQAPGEQYPSLFIMNSAFVLLPELRRKKLGARSLAIELLEAKATSQFCYVEVNAVGNVGTLNPDDPGHQYSGYAVWPQLGFDGPIPESLKEKEPELSPYPTVSALLAQPDGLELWLAKGGDVRLRFDLAEGSASWVVLNAYMAHNGIKVTR